MPLLTAFSINPSSHSVEQAMHYASYRNKQLLKFGFKEKATASYDKYVVCEYGNGLGAIYILHQFQNQGLYQEIMRKHGIRKIITLPECGISEYLDYKKIPYEMPAHSQAYHLIKNVYQDRSAKRSGVPLIYHIDEGGGILNHIGSSEIVKDAYYIHPLLQNTEDFINNKGMLLHEVKTESLLLAMEYRSVANSYLSHMSKDGFIGLTCPEVKDMLIADKVQNYKDFLTYHKGIHERSNELDEYFNNWMDILEIDYDDIVRAIE